MSSIFITVTLFILSNTALVHREQLKDISHTIYDYTNMSTCLHSFIEFSCSMIIFLTQRGNVLRFCEAIYPWDVPFFGWKLQTVEPRAWNITDKLDRAAQRRQTTTVEAETRWNWAYNLYHNSYITVTDSSTTINNAMTQSLLLLQYRIQVDSFYACFLFIVRAVMLIVQQNTKIQILYCISIFLYSFHLYFEKLSIIGHHCYHTIV